VPHDAPASLTVGQAARLERLVRAGFRLVSLEQFARYPAVEKDGFIALLDLSGEGVRLFGSVGYRVAGGIGVLVERVGGKAFVCKQVMVDATPDLLAAYTRVKGELAQLLAESVA